MKPLSDRAFGYALAVVFVAIFGIAWLFLELTLIWPLVVAALFGLTSLTVPWILLPLNRLWHVLAYRLGNLVNYVVLGIFYFLFFVPVGLVLRVFRWDPMNRTTSPQTGSYWSDVQRRTNAETLRDMF